MHRWSVVVNKRRSWAWCTFWPPRCTLWSWTWWCTVSFHFSSSPSSTFWSTDRWGSRDLTVYYTRQAIPRPKIWIKYLYFWEGNHLLYLPAQRTLTRWEKGFYWESVGGRWEEAGRRTFFPSRAVCAHPGWGDRSVEYTKSREPSKKSWILSWLAAGMLWIAFWRCFRGKNS